MVVPLHRKIIHFSKAVARHVYNGMRHVKDIEYNQRISKCEECPSNIKGECNECGCDISWKALWESEDCELNKWDINLRRR